MTDEPTQPELWHLVAITRKGRTDIHRNLDTETARRVYRSLLPDQYPREHIYPPAPPGKVVRGYSSVGMGWTSSDDGIQRVEVIGPPGAVLNPWEGVDPVKIYLDADNIHWGDPIVDEGSGHAR